MGEVLMNELWLSVDAFNARFSTEEACVEFLAKVKWPDGFVCTRCGHRYAYVTTTRRLPLYECASCRHQNSLIAGTVMEGSRTDLRKWLLAMFLISDPDHGISAVKLESIIEVTYKTAWLILHKIRHAMGEADKSVLLAGLVQVNAAIYGRPHIGTILRLPQEQPVFVAATMSSPGEPTYVKIKQVPKMDLSEKRILPMGLHAFAAAHIEPNAAVEFNTKRYAPKKLQPLLPVFARANMWLNKTFGGIGPRHLQAYLNEFCYRFNVQRELGSELNQNPRQECTLQRKKALQPAPVRENSIGFQTHLIGLFHKVSQLCCISNRATYAQITCK
jgi:hypothetical protein